MPAPSHSNTLCALSGAACAKALLLVLLTTAAQAQEPRPPARESDLTASGDQNGVSTRQLRVLDTQEVDLGSHSMIYNRVETPVLLPQPAPVERGAVPVAVHVRTDEELAEMRRWEALNHVTLFLSCTVYDGQFTEVRFRHGDSDITFWSSVNFHYLSQLFNLETKDTYYSLMMGVGDSSKEEFDQQNMRLRQAGRTDLVSQWPGDLIDVTPSHRVSVWRITSGGPVPPEAHRAIVDLHAHFDAHRDALIAARAEREAAQAAQEQWLRDNPPQTADTIIQYFPIRSSHSPTEARVLRPPAAIKPTRDE